MTLESIRSKFHIRWQDKVQDCIFLSIILLLSAILYIGYIGFYTDDWPGIGKFTTSTNQSFGHLFQLKYDSISRQRPVQIVYWVVLYQLFGANPIGYHLVNLFVLIAGIVLFYLVLRELTLDRLLALTIPLVYGLLPHYSTNRIWYTVFSIGLSMTLYFLSLYSDLIILRSKPEYFWIWKLLSIISLLGSTLCYEIFLPLFLLNPFLILYRKRQLEESISSNLLGKNRLPIIIGSNLLILFIVIIFKAMITTRIGDFALSKNYIKYLVTKSLSISYGDYIFRLPNIIWKIVHNYYNPLVLALGGIVGVIILAYLYGVASQSKIELPKWDTMLKLASLGLVIFGLGYAIFLTNSNIVLTPTGLGNRTAMAAAVGVAFSLVGASGWVSNLLSSSYARKRFFCLLITLFCLSGFLINNTIALFWISAYRQQLEILSDIQKQFPTLPAHSTVILDGACPYFGPGVIFETNWDTSGGLRTIYRDPTLSGDTVKPSLIVKEDGIFMPSKHFGDYHYSYKQLFIYNYRKKMGYQLKDAKTAQNYFANFNPAASNLCPNGYPESGVPLF